jgi:hypothetical protein
MAHNSQGNLGDRIHRELVRSESERIYVKGGRRL